MDKNQLLDLKKFIKQENPISRLTSLKVPRDLTLGGVHVPKIKKQFTPNLNVVRNKNKAKEILKKNEPKRKQQKSTLNNQDRKKDRFVQSSGIFSAGFNNDIKRASARFGGERRGDKENDGSNIVPMPTIKMKNWEIDSKNENNVFEDLIGCDEEMIEEKLPFEPVPWFTNKLGNDIKNDVKTEHKTDANFCDDTMQPAFKNMKIKGDFSEYWEDDIYDDYQPAFSLWDLPDSMCGKGLSDDPNCKDIFDYCLNDMVEGKVGKLVMRKSGKMEVHIGNIKYSLDRPDLDAYKEHIVSLDLKSDKGSSARVLGEIKNRYIVNPDWKSLLL